LVKENTSLTAALELLQELLFLFFEKGEIAMKCLIKYKWVKLPRELAIDAKGLLTYYIRLVTRAAFRKGMSHYCGFENPVEPGMWAGGIVGLKSILGVKKRLVALWIMNQLEDLGYLTWTLDP
jgi:hypothetical protein